MTTPQQPAHVPGPYQPDQDQRGAAAPPAGARQDTPTAVFSTHQLASQVAAGQSPQSPQPPAPAPSPFDKPSTAQGGAPGGQQAPPAQPPAQGPVPPQAQPQGPPQAPGQRSAGASYSSPIPVVRTHLGHALASEWTKIRSVRSTLWTLGVMFAMTVGIGVLAGWGFSTDDSAQLPVLAPGFFGLILGQLCVLTLGVLVVTAEYSTGMIRTTLTACPRRTRVLTAKALIFFLVSFLTSLVATSITAAVNAALLEGKPLGEFSNSDMFPDDSIVDGEVIATTGEWLGATVGASLYLSLLGLLSLAVGTLLRSSPAAITAMIGAVLLPFLISLFLFAEAVRDFGDKLREYSFLNGLSSLYRMPMAGEADGAATGWPLLGLLALVTAIALAGAYARVATRDV